MAQTSWFLACVLLFSITRAYFGHPVSSASQTQSDISAAVASLTAFALRLNKLERKVENRQAAVDRHGNLLSSFQNEMRRKASRDSIERTADSIRSQIVSLRQQVESQRAVAGLYVQKLQTLGGDFRRAESDLRHSQTDMREVKRKIDQVHLVCRTHKTGWARRANGAIYFLERHLIRCARGEVLQKFHMERWSDRPNSLVRYRYVCCMLNF